MNRLSLHTTARRYRVQDTRRKLVSHCFQCEIKVKPPPLFQKPSAIRRSIYRCVIIYTPYDTYKTSIKDNAYQNVQHHMYIYIHIYACVYCAIVPILAISILLSMLLVCLSWICHSWAFWPWKWIGSSTGRGTSGHMPSRKCKDWKIAWSSALYPHLSTDLFQHDALIVFSPACLVLWKSCPMQKLHNVSQCCSASKSNLKYTTLEFLWAVLYPDSTHLLVSVNLPFEVLKTFEEYMSWTSQPVQFKPDHLVVVHLQLGTHLFHVTGLLLQVLAIPGARGAIVPPPVICWNSLRCGAPSCSATSGPGCLMPQSQDIARTTKQKLHYVSLCLLYYASVTYIFVQHIQSSVYTLIFATCMTSSIFIQSLLDVNPLPSPKKQALCMTMMSLTCT